MKTDLEVIMRRLAEVPAVEGNVRVTETGSSAGPGVSRYQRKSAHLRDRDCSVDLTDSEDLGFDLTGD